MIFNPTNIILVIICFQSILFAFILVTGKSPKRTSNLLLALFLLSLGIQMALIISEQYSKNFKAIQPWMCVFGFAYGPLLYLYATSLIFNYFSLKISNLIHFSPIIILAAGILMGFDVCPKIGALLYVSLLVYTFFSIRAILSYRKVVKNTRSSSHLIDLKWLQWTMIVFSIILFADIIDHNFFDITTAYGVSFVHLVLLFLVNGMFYKGLKQPQIFMGITQSDQLITIVPKNDDNVNKIEEDVKEELDQIRHYMQLHKPFIDSNLSLHELARQLQMPPRRLSYLINKYLDQSFMAFINSYRIELAQERLSNPKDDKETVIEVMYEVGFNSKSSFNTLFKQKTGFTPTEFKKRQA